VANSIAALSIPAMGPQGKRQSPPGSRHLAGQAGDHRPGAALARQDYMLAPQE